MWLFRRAETDGAYHMAESGLALTACSTPMRLRPADVPATYPCSSARIRKPGIGMITREALNAGENAEGKSTPLCNCWMQSYLSASDRQSAHRSLMAGSRLARQCHAIHPVPVGRARPLAGTLGNAFRTWGRARIRESTRSLSPRTPVGHSHYVCACCFIRICTTWRCRADRQSHG